MGAVAVVRVDGQVDTELSGAAWVEVDQRLDGPARWTLRLPLSEVEGELPLAEDDRFAPGRTLRVETTTDDGPVVLVDGPVVGQSLHLTRGLVDAWIEVRGADVLQPLDRETKVRVWAEGTDADVVRAILGEWGLAGEVADTKGGFSEAGYPLVQNGSDLRLLQRLARRNGFLLWVAYASTGVPTVHFGRPALDTPAVLTTAGEAPSVEVLDIDVDFERATSTLGADLSVADRATLSLVADTSGWERLAAKDLRVLTGDVRSAPVVAPVDDAGAASARAEAVLAEAEWFVRVSCTTTAAAAKAVVQAPGVVRLDGIGARHSGRYLVAGCRHRLDANGHTMALELWRNAWEA